MRIKSIISSSLGNVMEWYDFGLFAVYSPLFSRLFFPTSNPHVALISIFSVFAIGFVCRPLGALLFGYLGDTQGRVKTLKLSILMISIPTFLIGLVPTYSSIGILAPILLVFIRIWQGISLGGEFSGNIIYLTETASHAYRARVTSLAATGANLGVLLAALVSLFITHFLDSPLFVAWGWRIPFLLSGAICLLVYATRLNMQETSPFMYLKNENLIAKNPIKIALKTDIPAMLRTIGLVCMGNSFYYLCFIYMPAFLAGYQNLSINKISQLITFFIASMLIFVPLAGWLCDHLGTRRMLLFNASLIAAITLPGFYFLPNANIVFVIMILGLFTIASSLDQGTTNIAVVENYPLPARYTGLSLSYNIGVGLFGGTAPLICEWLTQKTNLIFAPAFYIVFCALLTGTIAYFYVNKKSVLFSSSIENIVKVHG